MAIFNIRVELHGATYNDYEVLHTRLAQISCLRTITSGTGIRYFLPTAEYHYEGNVTAEAVVEAVLAIANAVRPNSSVLISELTRAVWRGLRQV